MSYLPAHDPAGRPLFATNVADPRGRSRAPVNRCKHCSALIAWIPFYRRIWAPVMVTLDPEGYHGTYDPEFEHNATVCRARRHLIAELEGGLTSARAK
jgi:hypothetical protein